MNPRSVGSSVVRALHALDRLTPSETEEHHVSIRTKKHALLLVCESAAARAEYMLMSAKFGTLVPTAMLWACVVSCALSAAAEGGPGGSAGSTAAAEDPTEVVQAAAGDMFRALDKDREMYRRDPAKVGQLVEKYLLPHFDIEAAARVVLGKHWRTVTPEQRSRFIDAFYHALLRNYAETLVEFTSDQLRVFPTRVDGDAKYATVRTIVRRSNGGEVDVEYELRKTPQGWKAWNVVIEGVSYVYSFQKDFESQIEEQGIDAVIKRLESGEKPARDRAK